MQVYQCLLVLILVMVPNHHQLNAGKKRGPKKDTDYLEGIATTIGILHNEGKFTFNCNHHKKKRCTKIRDLTGISRHYHANHIPAKFREQISAERIGQTLYDETKKKNPSIALENYDEVKYIDYFEEFIALQLIKDSDEVHYFCNKPGHGWYTTVQGAAKHIEQFHIMEIPIGLRSEKRILHYLMQHSVNKKKRSLDYLHCFGCDKKFPKEVLLYEHPKQCHVQRAELKSKNFGT